MTTLEKIIERLETYKDTHLTEHNSEMCLHCKAMGNCFGIICSHCVMDGAISIVKEAAEEHNNGWILCSEQMPKEYDNIFARYKGTEYWREGMSVKSSATVLVTIADIAGNTITTYTDTEDGKWVGVSDKYKVIAWQPLPKPYKSSVAQSSPEQKAADWKDAVMRTFTNTKESNYG